MRFFPIAVLLILFAASADPVDTAYDLLDAVEWQDGYALEGLLTEDLFTTITAFLDQARELVETDPVLAGNILYQRYRGRVTVEDFDYMTNEELLGRLMGEITLQSSDLVQSESAEMQGRNATAVITYFNGETVSFSMVWENSSWRIADSSLLSVLFN